MFSGKTDAELINAIQRGVNKLGLVEVSKQVNVALAFIGHETPRYRQLLSAWHWVLRSN